MRLTESGNEWFNMSGGSVTIGNRMKISGTANFLDTAIMSGSTDIQKLTGMNRNDTLIVTITGSGSVAESITYNAQDFITVNVNRVARNIPFYKHDIILQPDNKMELIIILYDQDRNKWIWR